MEEQTKPAEPADSASVPEVDPVLMHDQTDTSSAMPILPPGKYRCTVAAIEQKQNSKGTGNVIKIKLELADEYKTTTGERAHPGFPIFDHIAITPTQEYQIEAINRQLKRFQSACGFPQGAFFPFDRFLGRTVVVNLKVQEANDQYEESNKVRSYEIPKAV